MGKISLEIENSIAIMRINRPEALNALSRQIVDEMYKFIEDVASNQNVKALIIYSEGNFAAGADIGGMVDCDEKSAQEFSFSPTFNKISALKIPTIAAIEGYALGGGMELALACDMRIAADNAKMGFPEITLGIMPGAGGTVRAPKLIGVARAKEMIFMGGSITAQKAEAIGLVNLVVPKEEVFNSAMKWAEKIARLSSAALKVAKETIDQAYMQTDVLKGVEIEASNWAKMFNTEDQKEGMKAFLEKRKPCFQGK